MWCVVVCDLENLKNEEVMTPRWVAAPQQKKKHMNFQRVGVVGGKMDDKLTLKEIVTMHFWNKKNKNFG
jgi:hypothetical protein